MAKKDKYYIIHNFRRGGDLGVSISALTKIIEKSLEEIQGVKLFVPHFVFSQGPIVIKINNKGGVYLKLIVQIEYGKDIEATCALIRERVEHDLLTMMEINPTKIDIKIDQTI